MFLKGALGVGVGFFDEYAFYEFPETTCIQYESALLIPEAAIKQPDGRTINAAKYWINEFSKAAETMAESQRLDAYIKSLENSCLLQRGKMVGVTDEELKDILDDVLPRCPTGLLDDTNASLLQRALKTAKEQKNNDLVLAISNPFTGGKWSPYEPRLGALPNKGFPYKLEMFNKHYHKETLVPMIAAGQPGAQAVKEQCRMALEQHKSMDVINFDRPTVGALKNAVMIWDYLLPILDTPKGPEKQAPLNQNTPPPTKGDLRVSVYTQMHLKTCYLRQN